MIKKFNIFLVLLLLFISIGAVNAVDNENMTDIVGNEANEDTLDVSIDDNIDLTAASHTISDANYNQYFDNNGKLVSSDIHSGDTVNLNGSFSNKRFTFDIQVNIVGTSSNNMKESMVTLLKGASGSSVSNLNIANTKAETYGIFLNSASNCVIKDCTIVNTGKSSYCICLANNANYNNVTDNDLKAYGITYGHGSFTRSTPPLLLSGSHYNCIANNHVEADDANGIYLSSYSGGPLNGGDSNYNVIFNNTVHYNVLPTSWAYGIQIMGSNNTIDSNTVIGGYRGVSTAVSSNLKGGNIVINNKIINLTGADYNHPGVESGGEFGIVGTYNSYIANNTIIGAKVISTGAGISAIDNSIIENNYVEVTLKGRGIVANGNNVIIRKNIVVTDSGSGIYQKDEGSGLLIENNNVTSDSGVGILIEKINSRRMPKNVTIIGNVINTNNEYAIDASGVQADTSEIDYESNVVSGKINTPSGVIDSSKPTFIFKGQTHTITPENIRNYINDNGGLTSAINDGDILNFEGSFSNEVIYITKGVKITGKNPMFYNSTFKVTSGNVLIENLTIINKEAERVNAWGIFVNGASGVRIINNNISVNDPKASYAIYVLESTEIDVINNVLASEGDYLTFTLLSYSSEYCNFINNTVTTIGTGERYNFSPEKCIDGNELVIDGKSYCIDGNELVIDGKSYCIDGEEVVIDGRSYCIDGNELVIDGRSYCIDGNELVIDGKSYCIDGNELVIDGKSYSIGSEGVVIDGRSYCIDGGELVIDGKSYCIDGNELVIDGRSYCIDGNELVIDGRSYCIDGNELVIDGKSYCIDGNELVIDGKSYGSDYSTGNAHVVSEIYQTYGILLLYSSNNIVSGNDVKVTSKLTESYSTIGNASSQNSIVGIDLYFNSHNNTFSDNMVSVEGKDNYIYGMGVLGYFTGHNAPQGQGATNNKFIGNKINLDGPYCSEGIIIGDESEDTLIEGNVLNIKSDSVVYGIYFEMSQKSIVINNTLKLDSQAVYAIQGYSSSDNIISYNDVDGTAKNMYGILLLNGNNNKINGNTIKSKGNGDDLSFMNLDSIESGNAGIYLKANSTNNQIVDNNVTSAVGYAILLDDGAVSNEILNNYLVCEKGIGNKAVNNHNNNTVEDNYKFIASASVQAENVAYKGTGEFKVIFDSSVDGAIVEFYDIDGKCFAQSSVSNGVALAKYEFDSSYVPAQYIFSAKLSKEDYKASNYDIEFSIVNGNMIITLDNVTIEQGTSGNIIAKVTDEFGNPITNAVVQFNRINSVGRASPIGNATTDKNGIANLTYEADKALSVGNYNIAAKVNGVEYYNDANASSTLTIVEMISITEAKSYSVYYGNSVSYKLRIMDVNTKTPIAGKVVTFSINGKTKSVKTDANGYASYSVKLPAGSYTITATCDNKKVSNKITFKPTVIAKNLSKKKAKTIKYTVKVVDKKGKVVKNKKVTFKVKNKKYTAKTNKKGIATLTLKNFKVGKYVVYSTYGGCTVKTTLTVKK